MNAVYKKLNAIYKNLNAIYIKLKAIYIIGEEKAPRHMMRWGGIVVALLVAMTIVNGCAKREKPRLFDESEQESNTSSPDLGDIEEAGELIAVTFNGPDTYYEYRNSGTGLQFTMAEAFANSLGLRLRMEVAKDTASLIKMVRDGQADLVACELPVAEIKKNGLMPCGANTAGRSWAVRAGSPELLSELNAWYSPQRRTQAQKDMQMAVTNKMRVVRRQAVFYSKKDGVVSGYDALFLKAARHTGWDWQLIASQCYQESGFDKNAVSWAGARGLMQIMPSTASHYGVSAAQLFDPETNMMTAARHIKALESKLASVRDPLERKKFVLAAYNGGYGHVSDAMQLAKKYGRNPYRWSDVSYFILHLSEPRYYRDPNVHYGYMIGRETFNYVQAVMDRYTGYHSVLRNAMPKIGTWTEAAPRPHKRNRFSKEQEILSKDDSVFSVKK